MRTYTFYVFSNGNWNKTPDFPTYEEYTLNLTYCTENKIPFLTINYDEPAAIEQSQP